jgi:hypothetical protein
LQAAATAPGVCSVFMDTTTLIIIIVVIILILGGGGYWFRGRR